MRKGEAIHVAETVGGRVDEEIGGRPRGLPAVEQSDENKGTLYLPYGRLTGVYEEKTRRGRRRGTGCGNTAFFVAACSACPAFMKHLSTTALDAHASIQATRSSYNAIYTSPSSLLRPRARLPATTPLQPHLLLPPPFRGQLQPGQPKDLPKLFAHDGETALVAVAVVGPGTADEADDGVGGVDEGAAGGAGRGRGGEGEG